MNKNVIEKFRLIENSNFNFKNKKILVMGLGLNGGGLGVTKFLYKQGAVITVTDLKDENQLKKSLLQLRNYKNIKYVLGQHREEDFKNNDIIIKGAGIKWDNKYIKIALENGKIVDTAAGIFFELSGNKKIGITGSKGKSTTTTLIYEILKNTKKNIKIAGNISKSFFDEFDKDKCDDIYVLELSSWQLYDIALHKRSPDISVITTLLPDHLNYYKTMKNYINDKKNIYKFHSEKNILVLNFDNEYIQKYILTDEIKSSLIFISNLSNFVENYSKKEIKSKLKRFKNRLIFFILFDKYDFYILFNNILLKNEIKNSESIKKTINKTIKDNYFRINIDKTIKQSFELNKEKTENLEQLLYKVKTNKELIDNIEIENIKNDFNSFNLIKLFTLNNLLLKGEHNLYNISCAVAVSIIENISLEIIKKTISNFRGVKYRNEYLGDVNGIHFYNDTTATVPDAVAATIKSFEKKIILIAGGVDKELDLTNMVEEINKNVKSLYLFEGDGSEKLLKKLKENNYNKVHYFYNSIEKVVEDAYKNASKDDIIVLSPGFASFNMFKNEFERGDLFNRVFNNLLNLNKI